MMSQSDSNSFRVDPCTCWSNSYRRVTGKPWLTEWTNLTKISPDNHLTFELRKCTIWRLIRKYLLLCALTSHAGKARKSQKVIFLQASHKKVLHSFVGHNM